MDLNMEDIKEKDIVLPSRSDGVSLNMNVSIRILISKKLAEKALEFFF